MEAKGYRLLNSIALIISIIELPRSHFLSLFSLSFFYCSTFLSCILPYSFLSLFDFLALSPFHFSIYTYSTPLPPCILPYLTPRFCFLFHPLSVVFPFSSSLQSLFSFQVFQLTHTCTYSFVYSAFLPAIGYTLSK